MPVNWLSVVNQNAQTVATYSYVQLCRLTGTEWHTLRYCRSNNHSRTHVDLLCERAGVCVCVSNTVPKGFPPRIHVSKQGATALTP